MNGKLVVVTGAPRTGTSLTIRMLEALGVPPAAPPFLPAHKKIRDFNPGGFYDSRLRELLFARPRRGAIKALGGSLYLVPCRSYDKIIVCVRNQEERIESMKKLLRHSRSIVPLFLVRVISNLCAQAADEHRLPSHAKVLVLYHSQLVGSPCYTALLLTNFLDMEWNHDTAHRIMAAAKLVRKKGPT